MHKSYWLASLLLTVLVPVSAYAYGEGEDIPHNARVIHLLANEARTDPEAALSTCSSCLEGIECYKRDTPPLYWRTDLARSAQLHAKMISQMNCMQHPSPCVLISSIAKDYPKTCDGKTTCACKGGSATCGASGTDSSERIRMFTCNVDGTIAENISQTSSPEIVHDMWLTEAGGNPGRCELSSSTANGQTNVHRWNLLNPAFHAIGVGSAVMTVQDFGDKNDETNALTAGTHNGDANSLWFKTHYYSDIAASQVVLVIGDDDADNDSRCKPLTRSLGSENNGIYGTSDIMDIPECTPYYFEALDAEDNYVRFPTIGSLLYECNNKSWRHGHSASCLNPDDEGEEQDPNYKLQDDIKACDQPGGDNPGGDNPGGDNPGGDNPGGDNPGGDEQAQPSDDNKSKSDDCSATLNQPGQIGGWGLLFGVLACGLLRRRRSH